MMMIPKSFINSYFMNKLWILESEKIANCVKIELGEIILEILNLDIATELKNKYLTIIKDIITKELFKKDVMYEKWIKVKF